MSRHRRRRSHDDRPIRFVQQSLGFVGPYGWHWSAGTVFGSLSIILGVIAVIGGVVAASPSVLLRFDGTAPMLFAVSAGLGLIGCGLGLCRRSAFPLVLFLGAAFLCSYPVLEELLVSRLTGDPVSADGIHDGGE